MHILILSQYYDPEPVPKPTELAHELHLIGHKVSVVTGFPNYPSGELYPGYKLRFLQKSTIAGIEVTRTYEFPYHGKNALGRIFNYVSFMISAPFSLLINRDFDVIYVWHPPLTIGIAAWLISVLTGTPFVYDVQDIWPESVVVSGLVNNDVLIKILQMIEKFVYRRASSLFVVTDGARENLLEKGVKEEKVFVMPHWTDEKLFGVVNEYEIELIRSKYGFNNRFVIMFAGNLGTVQGLETIVSAGEILRDDTNILIVFVGEGSDENRLKELVKSKDLSKRICFIERQPIERISIFLASADVLLVHLKSSPLSDYVIPSKTTAYLASEKPILMAAGGAAAELIEDIEAGISIEPENPASMAEAIRDLSTTNQTILNSMGARGREYFLSSLSKKVVIPMYEKVLTTVANRK